MAWLGDNTNALKQNAQNEFEKGISLEGDYREARAFRMRIYLRARTHIDQLFVKAAERAEYFNELALINAAEGKAAPDRPVHGPFLSLKTSEGEVWSYLPEEITQKVFDLGWLYQGMVITGPKAIAEVQRICDQLGERLSATSRLTSLDFLREQLAQEGVNVDAEIDELYENEN